jgi:hypothetical protein
MLSAPFKSMPAEGINDPTPGLDMRITVGENTIVMQLKPHHIVVDGPIHPVRAEVHL